MSMYTLEPAAAPSDDYEPVTGLDRATKSCVRACEAEAAAKTASDYQHIIWSYGILWALFAGYGVFLWLRSNRQRIEMQDLERRLRETP